MGNVSWDRTLGHLAGQAACGRGAPGRKTSVLPHKCVTSPGGWREACRLGGVSQALGGRQDDASIASVRIGEPARPNTGQWEVPSGRRQCQTHAGPARSEVAQRSRRASEPCECDTFTQRKPHAPETNPLLGSGPEKAKSLTPRSEPRKEGGPVQTLAGWQLDKLPRSESRARRAPTAPQD